MISAVLAAVVLACGFLCPLEGAYSGPVMGALATDAEFVLRAGKAYVTPLDSTPPVLFGEYIRTGGVWGVRTPTEEWTISRGFLGFTLSLLTNDAICYSFIRTFHLWR